MHLQVSFLSILHFLHQNKGLQTPKTGYVRVQLKCRAVWTLFCFLFLLHANYELHLALQANCQLKVKLLLIFLRAMFTLSSLNMVYQSLKKL
jgi:hypothetical protein